MPTLRIPLVGSYVNRNVGIASTLASKDQFFINCYPETVKNQITGSGKAYLTKRPGYSVSSVYAGTGTPNYAICTWTGKTATAIPPVVAGFTGAGNTTEIWDIVNNTQVGGSIANTKDVVAITETVISGTANLVAYMRDSATSAYEQWFYPDGGAWTQTTDGDFPSNITGTPICMDGFVFNVTSDGSLWNSDVNSASAYTANARIGMGRYPDTGVTLARIHKYIIGFGRASVEFFENSGNPGAGSILRRTDTAFPIGALLGTTTVPPSPTVISAFGTVYWYGSNQDGAYIGIYRFGDGFKPEKISNASVDRLMESAGIAWIAGPMILSGMRHIVFNVGTSTSMLCYCIDTDQWWILTIAGGNANLSVCSTSNYSSVYGARTYWTDIGQRTGQQFTFTNQDNASNFTMTVETESLDAGTDKMKFWKKLRAVFDVQSSTSNLAISWADDDYATYSTPVNIDMAGTQGWITGLGASRRRSWKFTNTASTPCRIHAIEIDYELGTH